MASEASSYMLIFIASMVVVSGVAGLFSNEMRGVTDALGDRSDVVNEKFRTDIEIISEPGSDIHDLHGNGNITVYVKNTGERLLTADPDRVDVLVDGELQTGVNVSVEGGTEWQPGTVANVTFEYGSLGFGDHRVTVSVTGDQDTLAFRKG